MHSFVTLKQMTLRNVSPGNSKLGIEIALVVLCKLLFIFGLWYFFFSPAHRPEVTTEVVGNVILSNEQAPSQPNSPNNIRSPQ